MLLGIDQIRVDGGTQTRAALNDATVAEYAEAIGGGASFPPLIVFHDGGEYWLADGFHRLNAYREIGAQAVPVDVRQGTRRDAILFSCGANGSHGLRRTNEDKRRAVETLLRDEEWGRKSDRWIAEKAAVSTPTVSKLRSSNCKTFTVAPREGDDCKPPPTPAREGRDGKVRRPPQREPAGAPPPTPPQDDPEPPPQRPHVTPAYGSMSERDTAKIILDTLRIARGSFRDPAWELLLRQVAEIIHVRTPEMTS